MLRISCKDHVTNEVVRAKIQQATGPHEDLLTIVKRRKLQWYGHVSRSSGLAKTILQGKVKRGKKTRRTKEKVGRQHQGMDKTRGRIRRISELREILLSFQAGFNLVNAAVVSASLESISGLELSSVITEPRYLKLVTVSSFCPFTLISLLILQVWRLCRHTTNFASSSSPAKPSMSSAKRRLVIVLPPMLTVPSWSSKASVMVLSRNML